MEFRKLMRDNRLLRKRNLDSFNGQTSQQNKQMINLQSGINQEVGCFFVRNQTIGNIFCCKCGSLTPPNKANMCLHCLCMESRHITDDLPSRVSIIQCRECMCYLQPPKTWLKAESESKELLSFCLRRLKKLAEFRLTGAEFLFTEPHSKRIKLRIKVQKEVLDRVIVEKTHDIEYVVVNQMCPSCMPADSGHWEAVVQARQYVPHMRTFLYLENLIIKHEAANSVVKLEQVNRGLDFFFANKCDAVKFFDFMCSVVPVISQNRFHKQLISQDSKSNTSRYRFSIPAVISPICHDDLIYLSPKLSSKLGQIGSLVICTKVRNTITLLNPFMLKYSVIDGDQYWRAPFEPILSSKQLVEYIVLDVELVSAEVDNSRYTLADVEIARVSDFGKNDRIISIRTHLGNLLKPGDYALGYDLYGANFNNSEAEEQKDLFPAAILIKKKYSENFQSKTLTSSSKNMKTNDSEYEQFLRDLEDEPESRFNLSLDRKMKVHRRWSLLHLVWTHS